MTSRTDRLTRAARRRATDEGNDSMSAARLAWKVVDLLNRAREASGVRNSALAERLGVSEGRISQVLNGDGNVQVATLGRFLSAYGYDLLLVAQPRNSSLPRLEQETRLAGRSDKRWDFFEQVYLSKTGVSREVSAVECTAGDRLEPVGGPRHVGYVEAARLHAPRGRAIGLAWSTPLHPNLSTQEWVQTAERSRPSKQDADTLAASAARSRDETPVHG